MENTGIQRHESIKREGKSNKKDGPVREENAEVKLRIRERRQSRRTPKEKDIVPTVTSCKRRSLRGTGGHVRYGATPWGKKLNSNEGKNTTTKETKKRKTCHPLQASKGK